MKLKSHLSSLLLMTALLLTAVPPLLAQQAQQAKPLESLSAAEFSKLSREMSEEGGYFRSDNFTSNETPYLHIVDKLKQLAQKGGAYLGVGPEQNFTYIAKVRPQIVILFDIRRQAVLQHLMYKAIFTASPTRAQFFSLLLSRPLPKEKPFAADAPLNDLLAHFSKAVADEKAYVANLASIRKAIQEDFQFPLSDADQKALEYVYKSFRDEGLEISYRMEGGFGGRGNFPTFQEILAGVDLQGKQGNFLASVEDYDFIRSLHRKNLIIPVVADFAGKKGIAAVADFLRKNNYTVTAFYTSNVEQYLFMNSVFAAFAENVRKLPITDKSLFIRSASGRYSHPARLNNHRSATLLQLIQVFLKDVDEKAYGDYGDLVMTHYIAADSKP